MPQQCTMMTTITVFADMTPVVSADGPLSFCALLGEDVTLDGGRGHASYPWSRDGSDLMGETAQTILADVSGEDRLLVVDRNGCIWTSDPVAVFADACPGCPALACDAIEILPEPACEGQEQVFSAQASGGVGALEFEWDFDDDGLTDAVGSPVAWTRGPGTWPVSLTVRDACAFPGPQSCVLQTTATVSPEQTPTITPDGPTDFCAAVGETLSLDAGPGYASYLWSLNGSPLPMSNQQVLPAAASGSYAVTVIDGNGCSWNSAALVVISDSCECAIPLECQDIVVEPFEACEGEEQSFRAVFRTGLGPYQVAWDFDEDGAPDAMGNPVLWTLPLGTTSVAVTIVDTGCPPFPSPGCTLELSVTVEAVPLPTLSADGPTNFCANSGEFVTLTAAPGFSSYQWTINGVDLPGETAETLLVGQSGSFAVSVRNASDCEASSAPIAVDASSCGAACRPLVCEDLLIEPGPPCDELLYTLTAMASGGEGALEIEWDLDGDGTPDALGSPVSARLPEGMQAIVMSVRDACASPVPQECTLSEPLLVPGPAVPPLEVSQVLAGDPPLLLLDGGALLVFEEESTALAFNLHLGEIGSWYGAHPGGGTDCHRVDAVSGGDGTVSVVVNLPVDSWLLVTATDDCFEGPAGSDSFGAARSDAPSWQVCGPLP